MCYTLVRAGNRATEPAAGGPYFRMPLSRRRRSLDSGGGNLSTDTVTSAVLIERPSRLVWPVALAATLALLTGLFLLMVFNDAFHDYEHQRLGTEARLGAVHPSELVDELQDYFLSSDKSLLRHPYLSYRERLHYLEVRQVMRTMLGAFFASSAAAAALLAWLLMSARRRGLTARQIARYVLRNSAWILLIMIAASAFLALDFDRSFVTLHGLLFEGKNWVLPTYSVTARVFPTQYFLDFFLAYCALLIGTVAAILGTLAALRRLE